MTPSDTPRTEQEARRFMNRLASLRAIDRTQVCRHGHFDCSTTDRGPCENEVAAEFNLFEDAPEMRPCPDCKRHPGKADNGHTDCPRCHGEGEIEAS